MLRLRQLAAYGGADDLLIELAVAAKALEMIYSVLIMIDVPGGPIRVEITLVSLT